MIYSCVNQGKSDCLIQSLAFLSTLSNMGLWEKVFKLVANVLTLANK